MSAEDHDNEEPDDVCGTCGFPRRAHQPGDTRCNAFARNGFFQRAAHRGQSVVA